MNQSQSGGSSRPTRREWEEAQEALGQFLDLWRGVTGFLRAYVHEYPVGDLAIWVHFDHDHAAVPAEWLGVPVVVRIERG